MQHKKLIVAAAMAALCSGAYAQSPAEAAEAAAKAIAEAPVQEAPAPKPVYWTRSLVLDLGFNQTGLVNWAAGGYNSIALAASLDGKIDYAKDLTKWDNRLQMDYGFFWAADKPTLIQKSTDRIYLESKFAYKTSKDSKWDYTAGLDFKSQFSDTWGKYEQDADKKWYGDDLKSAFFSPAYLNLALGMEWTPNEWFNINLAPLTGGMVVCLDERNLLRKTYGMHAIDEAAGLYKSVLFQFGAQVKANARASINDKFNVETQVVLFYDYINRPRYTGFPIRVNWDNKISWMISKLFKIGLSTWLIYDPFVAFEDIPDGNAFGKVQFKEFLSINFTWSIANKK